VSFSRPSPPSPVPLDGAVLAVVREQALLATDLSFTISDARQHDTPLIWVNPAFTRVTGYTAEQSLGRNCRFLQGPDTDPAAVAELRAAQREQRSTTLTLLNYRADGAPFWNEVSLSPVLDEGGELRHVVGVQNDVTARVRLEEERQRAHQSERAARAQAEGVQRQLALLAEATSLLAATLDQEEALQRLVRLTVPMLADFCAVDLLDPAGSTESRRVAAAHVDPNKVDLLYRLAKVHPMAPGGLELISQVLAGGHPALVPEMPETYSLLVNEEAQQIYRQLEPASLIVVPLLARRQVLGTLTLATARSSGRAYGNRDLELAGDLARRAALSLDNARLYQREHRAAETLQRSLLPVLPDVPGLEIAARYLPSGQGAEVGGDWYDVLALPDGTTGLAVGDVMGHDLSAAAAMGQLSGVLRSYAWGGDGPAVVLDRLDELVQALDMAQLATAFYARLETGDEHYPPRLRYASAGHPPPVLRLPGGGTRLLDDEPGVLIGAPYVGARTEAMAEMPRGSVLLLVTDGLLERPDDGLAERQERLRRLLAGPVGALPLEELCEAVLEDMVPGAATRLRDDVAMLAIRVR